MRFFSSLAKFLIYLSLVLLAVFSALFYFETGSWLVLPLVNKAGDFFLEKPLKLEIQDIKGSVHKGFSIEKIKLLSGDTNLFNLDYIAVSPDWDLILKLADGVPFVKKVKIRGVESDLDKILAVSEFFASSEDKKDEEKPLNLTINPFNLEVEDVKFGTPYANLELNNLSLDDNGKLFLDTKLISGENIFPVKADADINFENIIEIISSDLMLGSGRGNLAFSLENLKLKLNLKSLVLQELLKFAPGDINIEKEKFSGLINAEINMISEDVMKISGFLAMPEADIMDVPLNFNLPFEFSDNKLFSLNNAILNTDITKLKLSAFADISDLNAPKITAKGQAKNLSLTEIGKIFAPELKLKGSGGDVDFDVETIANSNILENTKADIKANIPVIQAMGVKVLDNLAAKVKLAKNQAPKLDITGKILGGKLFARGEVNKKDFSPEAIISLVNVDAATLVKTLETFAPEAAKSIQNPAGKISLRTIIHKNLNLDFELNSAKVAANGFTLNDINANANYNTKQNSAKLESFIANLGKALITASGSANIGTGEFNAALRTENFDPAIIPDLKKLNLAGIYNFHSNISGNYNNVAGIKADTVFNAKNIAYDKFKAGDLYFPVKYANNVLNINDARAILPGGVLNLKGNVNLTNINNPGFNLALHSNAINLAKTLKSLNIKENISGKISGAADIQGNLKNPIFHAALRAEDVKYGQFINMPQAVIAARGDMKKITLNKLEAKINNSNINAAGSFIFDKKNFNNSTLSFHAMLKHFNLKKNLAAFIGTSPVDGVIDAQANVSGTLAAPKGDIKITRPIFYGNNEIRDIALKLNSPKANNYKINAKARLENFKPELNIDITQRDGIYLYNIDTNPLDINSAIETQIPSMAGLIKGNAKINIAGSTQKNSNINIKASSNKIKILDKISIENIFMPIIFSQAKNKIEMKNGVAYLSDGIIKTGLDVDLTKKIYTGKLNVSDLDFGKLAGEFLTEGEVIGKVNAQANIKGNFGVMPTNFANGKFSTTPGYIHKMSIIDKVTPTKKISFENISGSFFWDGKDVFLNPGTGAKAANDEPLYRYANINGSLGIPGKGLNLLCDGRFDLKILDQLLGAMKGVFQYMTGNLAQNILRDTAGRIFGVKRKDFQNVSFGLANSWNELRLLDLKITKPIEDFLPIDMLNKDEEKQRDDTQFKLNLKIPVGRGDTSIEEESTGDQFKQQLIDNLFNIGF